MNTPVRVGETIEGSRTMRNRPYPVLKCSRFPRTSHELDSHSKKIRCSRAAPTLDHTLAALLKANPTSLAASNTVPRVSRPN